MELILGFFSWYKTATLDEILLLLFVVTGIGFIRVILFTGRTLAASTNDAIERVAEKFDNLSMRLDKLDMTISTKVNNIDETLQKITTAVLEFKLEVHDEISRIERRVALTENDMEHARNELKNVERRKEPRDLEGGIQ